IQAVTLGKVTEHIIPYFPEFKYNPKDVRFIGTPIDLIVFDGLADDEVKKIVMVEVKTGKTANLTSKERQIENCVKEGNVYFEVIHHKEWYEQYNEDVNSLENKEEIEPYLSKCPKCGAENSKPLKTWTLRPEKNEPIVVGLYKCENCGAFYRDSVPIN
ncbi:MAG: Holliday junction resolvase-like protein, partial [Candidatus Methanomethylicaceae archaeon]